MGRLLKLEWMKVSTNRSFQVIFLLYILALPAFFYIGKTLDTPKELGMDAFYSFPFVWAYLGYVGSWITYFCMGFLGVIIITFEYSNKTMRQNIMTGMSRSEFLTGKLLIVAAISMIFALYFALVSLFFGFTNTDYIITSKVFQEGHYFFTYFLQCFCYMSFALVLGLILKRGGLAIFVYTVYGFFLEKMIRYAIHIPIFGQKSSLYYPQNSFNDLVAFPREHAAATGLEKMSEGAFGDIFLDTSQAVIWSIIWVTLIIISAYAVINRRDL